VFPSTGTLPDLPPILYSVERLYCKRPIQCLASSKILTPHPLTARRVCTPSPLVRGEDTLAGWKVGGRSIFWKTPDTALYSTYVSTLCSKVPPSPTGGREMGRYGAPSLFPAHPFVILPPSPPPRPYPSPLNRVIVMSDVSQTGQYRPVSDLRFPTQQGFSHPTPPSFLHLPFPSETDRSVHCKKTHFKK
jgi:hypothetical protein